MPRTVTVAEPGVQGATMAGTHGVGTPDAAAVSTLQVPNGGMFVIGTKSMMLATGFDSALTSGGATISVEGAVPDVHCKDALMATSWGMAGLRPRGHVGRPSKAGQKDDGLGKPSSKATIVSAGFGAEGYSELAARRSRPC